MAKRKSAPYMSAGKSEAEYIKQLYGSNMTVKIFKGILKDTIIASHYQQDYIDSLQYTDEELQKYYEENKNSFDVANYEMITFKGAAASTKDADGNTVQPTEEESAAALQKAKDAAAAVLETVKSGILPEKAAKEPQNHGGKQDDGAGFLDKGPAPLPGGTQHVAGGRRVISGQLHDKRSRVAGERPGFLQTHPYPAA